MTDASWPSEPPGHTPGHVTVICVEDKVGT